MFNGTGPAFNCEGNIDSYLNLRLKTAKAGSSSSGTLIVAAIVAVLRGGRGRGGGRRSAAPPARLAEEV